MPAAFSAVQHKGHILEPLFLVVALQFGEHIALQQPGTYHKEGTLCQLFDDLRIGHNVYRRTVDEDVIVTAAQRFHQFPETGFCQQFRRVGRNGTYRQDGQAGIIGFFPNQSVNVFHPFAQIVTQSRLGRIHIGRCRTVAQIAIDDQHPFPLQGKGGGNIQGKEGLPATRIKGSNQRDAGLALGFPGIENELQIGAQHAESLVDNVALALMDDNLLGGFCLLALLVAFCQGDFPDKR